MYGGQTEAKDPLVKKWNTKEGLPDKFLWLPRTSLGVDTNTTFE